ncbi:hypothetical protein FD01_GL002413 [Lacticaseibacillus manihotivorans DSM 13343 = JCM 12514]|jgi:hypothetical protein|uniref:Uncharacterized protein n=2 Tax=Lacticaseibacillus manihotivorans TaxID=88233 RepID=A0A0R1R5X6_9LACO|nr:hypothetical protein FD01_GL002413 [Lacticaseibacillus manihotivorans DSM 13343 = JCM 12514]
MNMSAQTKQILTWIVIAIVALILLPIVSGIIALLIKLVLLAVIIGVLYWAYQSFIAKR